jgi:hypothetical protein
VQHGDELGHARHLDALGEHCADEEADADGRRQHRQARRALVELSRAGVVRAENPRHHRHGDADGHADHAELIAAPGGLLLREPSERANEEHASREVRHHEQPSHR